MAPLPHVAGSQKAEWEVLHTPEPSCRALAKINRWTTFLFYLETENTYASPPACWGSIMRVSLLALLLPLTHSSAVKEKWIAWLVNLQVFLRCSVRRLTWFKCKPHSPKSALISSTNSGDGCLNLRFSSPLVLNLGSGEEGPLFNAHSSTDKTRDFSTFSDMTMAPLRSVSPSICFFLPALGL